MFSLAIVATLLLMSAAPTAAAPHASSNPAEIMLYSSHAYFAATTASHGRELWRTDGTANGTEELVDINPSGSADPSNLTVGGGKLYFNAYDGTGWKLWVTDGTVVGTLPLSDGVAQGLTWVIGSTLMFVRDTTIWRSDGTAVSTAPVLTIPDAEIVQSAGMVGNLYFFFVYLGQDVNEWWLWKSDGTPSGTVPVDLIVPNGAPFAPGETESPPGSQLLYFTVEMTDWGGGVAPADLWKSNGTAAGTKRVKDIVPGQGPDEADGVSDLTFVSGRLYFTVDNAELWMTWGSAASTRRLAVVNSTGSGAPMVLSKLSSFRLLFSGDDGNGADLWKSSGSAATTKSIHQAGPHECWFSDFNCTRLNFQPVAGATAVGLELFYPSAEGGQGIELWASNGTGAGTHLVKNIRPGAGSSRPSDFAFGGPGMWFVANDGAHGRELWSSDGTPSGTHMVKDINPG